MASSWSEHDSAALDAAQTGITFAVMTADVIRNCDNLASQHPHYGQVGRYINEAKDEFQRMVLGRKQARDLAPVLFNWRWSQTTVNTQNYLALPDSLLVLESVTYTKLTTTYDPSATTEYPSVEVTDANTFGYFSKTQTGWPTLWRRAAGRVELWPTPTTTYLTKVVLRGFRAEDDLTGTATLKMDARLHPLITDLATAITMEKMGWEQAADKRAKAEARIARTLNIRGEERARDVTRTTIAGSPR
jgi:uncharacterized protein (DUF2267 family)